MDDCGAHRTAVESSPVRSRGFLALQGANFNGSGGARNQTVCGVPVGPGPGPGHPEPPQTVCPGRRRAKRQGETSPHLKLTWAVGSRSLENPLDLTSELSTRKYSCSTRHGRGGRRAPANSFWHRRCAITAPAARDDGPASDAAGGHAAAPTVAVVGEEEEVDGVGL